MSLSAIPRKIRREVFQRDEGRCQYCQLAQFGQASVFHVNHVVPRCKGGLTEMANLVLQCPHCSLHKSDKTISVDPVTSEDCLLFNPLVQRWYDHFSIGDDGYCRGLTAIGRTAVEALRMNDSLPLIARAIQLRLGIITVSGK